MSCIVVLRDGLSHLLQCLGGVCSNATNQHADEYDDLQEVKVASLLWKRIWTWMGLYFLGFPFFQGPLCIVAITSFEATYLPMIHLSKMQVYA